jgi:hypothetical protein
VTLKPGTVGQFSARSLAAVIEASFAAELRAAKNQPLPDIQVEDRRILFAAIAQGVLQYLAGNDADLVVNVGTGGAALQRQVQVDAPTLTVSGNTVSGYGWAEGSVVTLTWAHSGIVAGTRSIDFSRQFSITVAPPAGGDVLGARDTAGNAAAVRIG